MKLPLLFLLLSSVSSAQLSIDTSAYLFYDSTTQSTTDFSVYLGFNLNEEPSQVTLKFDTITAGEYGRFKKKYRSKISFPVKLVTKTDTTIVIHTDHKDVVLEADEKGSYERFSYYKGFFKPLNLFIVTYVDGKNEIGVLTFIDKKTGKTFLFESGYDEPCETALLSPKNNFLLSYANSWYGGDQCVIMVLKINQKKKKYRMAAYASADMEHCKILEIVWIDEKSFAVSLVEIVHPEEGGEDVEVPCFLKARFVTSN